MNILNVKGLSNKEVADFKALLETYSFKALVLTKAQKVRIIKSEEEYMRVVKAKKATDAHIVNGMAAWLVQNEIDKRISSDYQEVVNSLDNFFVLEYKGKGQNIAIDYCGPEAFDEVMSEVKTQVAAAK